MISKFSQCIISGRDSMLIALLITAVLGCIVRGHHTFMVGFDLASNTIFANLNKMASVWIHGTEPDWKH